MRKFFLFTLLLFISLGAGVIFRVYNENKLASFSLVADLKEGSGTTSAPEFIGNLLQEKEDKDLVLMFVGDIMLDRVVKSSIVKNGEGDYKFPFLKIADTLSEADVLFGNLEGPISDKGINLGKKYSFRMDPRAIDGLLYAGFDVLSLANNHAEDWGRVALTDSLARVSGAGIVPVGAGINYEEAYKPKIIEKNGIKIAYLAFTDFPTFEASPEKSQGDLGASTAGVARARDESIIAGIKKAKELGANFIIASYHFGEEYQKLPSERQKSLAHLAIDNGANLVIGHHPHVTQTYEEYKDGYIAYSLGNFVFDQSFSTSTMEGAILKITLENNKIKSKEVIKTRLNKYFQPRDTRRERPN